MSSLDVKVPDIGDFTDVPVIEIFVKPGDTVAAEDSLVTLESDKATMDVPAPAAGTVREVKVKVGDKVSEGTLIVVLETTAAAATRAAPVPAATASAPPAAPKAAHSLRRRPPRFQVRPRTRARRISNATCSCWARAPGDTAPRSAPPTSA